MITTQYSYAKIDSQTIQVTKTVTEVTVTVNQYARANLQQQKQAIQDQKVQQQAVRDAELAEINAFIAAAQ